MSEDESHKRLLTPSYWSGWASNDRSDRAAGGIGPVPDWVDDAQVALDLADFDPDLLEALLERSDIPEAGLASVVCQLSAHVDFMSPAFTRQVSGAVHRWFEALDVDVLPARVTYALADVFTDVFGLHEDAEAAYRAVGRDPGLGSAAINDLGVLFAVKLGRFDAAEAAFIESIALDSNSPLPHVSLANLLTDHFGKHADAEEAYRRAIAKGGAGGIAWYGLANLLQDHRDRYAEAEDAYRKSLDIDPSNAMAWHGLGCLLDDHLGRYDEAEQAHRQSVELAPGYLQAWNCLGNLLQDRAGRYEQANEAYSNGLRAALAQCDAEGAGYLLYNQCRLLRFRLPWAEDESVALAELRETLGEIDDQDLELVHGVGLGLTDQRARLRRTLPDMLTRHVSQDDRLWGRILAHICGCEHIAAPLPGPQVRLSAQELEEFGQVLGMLADRIPTEARAYCAQWLREAIQGFVHVRGARNLDMASIAPYRDHLNALVLEDSGSV